MRRALLGLAAISACAPKVPQRQTEIVEKTGKVSVSAAVLRARVNDLVDGMAGKIEETADRFIAESKGGAVRHRALALKVDLAAAALGVIAYRLTIGRRLSPAP